MGAGHSQGGKDASNLPQNGPAPAQYGMTLGAPDPSPRSYSTRSAPCTLRPEPSLLEVGRPAANLVEVLAVDGGGPGVTLGGRASVGVVEERGTRPLVELGRARGFHRLHCWHHRPVLLRAPWPVDCCRPRRPGRVQEKAEECTVEEVA